MVRLIETCARFERAFEVVNLVADVMREARRRRGSLDEVNCGTADKVKLRNRPVSAIVLQLYTKSGER